MQPRKRATKIAAIARPEESGLGFPPENQKLYGWNSRLLHSDTSSKEMVSADVTVAGSDKGAGTSFRPEHRINPTRSIQPKTLPSSSNPHKAWPALVEHPSRRQPQQHATAGRPEPGPSPPIATMVAPAGRQRTRSGRILPRLAAPRCQSRASCRRPAGMTPPPTPAVGHPTRRPRSAQRHRPGAASPATTHPAGRIRATLPARPPPYHLRPCGGPPPRRQEAGGSGGEVEVEVEVEGGWRCLGFPRVAPATFFSSQNSFITVGPHVSDGIIFDRVLFAAFTAIVLQKIMVKLSMDQVINFPRGYGYVEFKRADAEKMLLDMDASPQRKPPASPRMP